MRRFFRIAVLAVSSCLLATTVLADDCLLRIRVVPDNVAVHADRIEVHLLGRDGDDVRRLEDEPRQIPNTRNFWGTARSVDIEIDHMERRPDARLALVVLVVDETGDVVQSNGLTEAMFGNLECNNAFDELRVRASTLKPSDLSLRHLDGFLTPENVLNNRDVLPLRLGYLTEVFQLNVGFYSGEHRLFEVLLSSLFQSFMKLADEERNWVLRELEEIIFKTSYVDPALRQSLLIGYVKFLTTATEAEGEAYLAHGSDSLPAYAQGQLGTVMATQKEAAIQLSASMMSQLAQRANFWEGYGPAERAQASRQCMSMSRSAFQAIRNTSEISRGEYELVEGIFFDAISCVHDYYDLTTGASWFDTQEVLEDLNDDQNLGAQVRRRFMHAYQCLPEDLQNEIARYDVGAGNENYDMEYVIENMSAARSKCR